jgi:YegS/Rv2252/BmrU family lipid kinase
MLPLIIINPSSARGATRAAWPGMASDLATHFGAFNVAFTKQRGDAARLASHGAKEGRGFIVACGGDGTISEVANGILEAGVDVELGIIPSGTGGDFRRSLGISTHPATAARQLLTGRTRRIDVGRVTFFDQKNNPLSRYFLNVASFGMSSEVIKRVKADDEKFLLAGMKWLSGRIGFAAATLQTTLQTSNIEVVVQLDEKAQRRLTVANLSVANARYFGGGMKIAPAAKLNDGRFDVITIGDLSSFDILANAHRLYLGKHLAMRQVQQAHAQRLEARAVEKNVRVAIEIDGELPGYLPATFEIVPQALRVRCPIRGLHQG